MAYIFKNKFEIRDLVDRPVEAKKILIAEPESYACALFAYHLSGQDFFVKSCGDRETLLRRLPEFSPHLAIINPELIGDTARHAARRLQKFKEDYPSLFIITVSLAGEPQDIKHLMTAGVNAHIDRKFTKPQDVVHIVESLLI